MDRLKTPRDLDWTEGALNRRTVLPNDTQRYGEETASGILLSAHGICFGDSSRESMPDMRPFLIETRSIDRIFCNQRVQRLRKVE
jgi:hypothetical protein